MDATDASFDTEADASALVLVDLWAPWCGPCRFVSPILEELSRDYRGRIKVIKVNVDDNPSTAQRYEAFSIPTIMVLRDGQPLDRIVGAHAQGATGGPPGAASLAGCGTNVVGHGGCMARPGSTARRHGRTRRNGCQTRARS